MRCKGERLKRRGSQLCPRWSAFHPDGKAPRLRMAPGGGGEWTVRLGTWRRKEPSNASPGHTTRPQRGLRARRPYAVSGSIDRTCGCGGLTDSAGHTTETPCLTQVSSKPDRRPRVCPDHRRRTVSGEDRDVDDTWAAPCPPDIRLTHSICGTRTVRSAIPGLLAHFQGARTWPGYFAEHTPVRPTGLVPFLACNDEA